MSYERTPEHRKKQSEMIRRWKPWEKSTGPRTPEGKAKTLAALNSKRIRASWLEESADEGSVELDDITECVQQFGILREY